MGEILKINNLINLKKEALANLPVEERRVTTLPSVRPSLASPKMFESSRMLARARGM